MYESGINNAPYCPAFAGFKSGESRALNQARTSVAWFNARSINIDFGLFLFYKYNIGLHNIVKFLLCELLSNTSLLFCIFSTAKYISRVVYSMSEFSFQIYKNKV